MEGKRYFGATSKQLRSKVITRAAILADDIRDDKKSMIDKLCWAAALYAAVEALESKRPALMAAAKRLLEELVENEELREGEGPDPEQE